MNASASDNAYLRRNIARHESSTRHREAVQDWLHSQTAQSSAASSSRTQVNVHSILGSILASSKPQPNHGSSTLGPSSPSPSPPDVDMNAFTDAWEKEGPAEPEHHLPPAFITTLEEYLDYEDDINRDSDDDEGERSEVEEPESYLGKSHRVTTTSILTSQYFRHVISGDFCLREKAQRGICRRISRIQV